MIVQCHTRCWNSKRARRYYPGDQDDIDPKEPVALYFTFPPGTEVYFKERGDKNKPIEQGFRVVPGAVPKKPEPEPEPQDTATTEQPRARGRRTE